jgi:hypothetical protein
MLCRMPGLEQPDPGEHEESQDDRSDYEQHSLASQGTRHRRIFGDRAS